MRFALLVYVTISVYCRYNQQKLDLCIFSRYWKPTCILINQDGFSSAYGRKSLGLNSNPVFISELLSGQLLTKA